jgi:hypothetical protein
MLSLINVPTRVGAALNRTTRISTGTGSAIGSAATCAGSGRLRNIATRVAAEGTHHVTEDGQPLYVPRFLHVLPFHPPGLAPVQLSGCGQWTHIKEDGTAAYPYRWKRAFGFYEGLSAIVRPEESAWQHILFDGSPAYSSTWSWAGNFQSSRCAVRTQRGHYQHIDPKGRKLPGGPYAYAGDYREGYAVVRALSDGLCRHVDLDGHPLLDESAKGYLDLDVFHKGWARARDERGWFFIDRAGRDLCKGRRFADLEPAYNGQALARTLVGERLVLDESMTEVVRLPNSETEKEATLQKLSTGYWPAFALRLGLQAGIPERANNGTLRFPRGLRSAVTVRRDTQDELVSVAEAWRELGLLKFNEGSGSVDNPSGLSYRLTPLGALLLPGTPQREKAAYWLQDRYLRAWLPGASANVLDPSSSAKVPGLQKDTFAAISGDAEVVKQSHKALALHAAQDWQGIEKIIVPAIEAIGAPVNKHLHIVDVGGGAGVLLKELATADALKGARRKGCSIHRWGYVPAWCHPKGSRRLYSLSSRARLA